MDFKTSQKILSKARIGKYETACAGDKKKSMQLYLDLTHIREFRNRIAHHEPICFDGSGHINTTFARTHYQLICDYIFYLGQPSDDVVSWAEKPDSILNLIDKMTP